MRGSRASSRTGIDKETAHGNLTLIKNTSSFYLVKGSHTIMNKATLAAPTLTLKPKQVVKRLLSALPDRARDVITNRYGLGDTAKKMTLEAIGKKYGVTRERVRQIENYALMSIRKSDAYQKEKASFDQLEKLLHSLGGVVSEDEILEHASVDKSTQNHVHFVLVVGEAFKKEREDEHFKHRWYIDDKLAEKVHDALRKLYKNLSDNDLVGELDIIAQFLTHVEDVADHLKQEHIVKRYLNLSKAIAK